MRQNAHAKKDTNESVNKDFFFKLIRGEKIHIEIQRSENAQKGSNHKV